MSIVRAVRHAAVEAVLGAGLVGVVEGVRVAVPIGSPAVAAVAAGTATLGLVLAAVIVRVALAVIVRLPVVAQWRSNLAAGGERRVVAVWRAALVGAGLALVGGASIAILVALHERFRFTEAGPVALGGAAAILVLAVVMLAVAPILDARVRHRLPATLLDGRGPWLAARLVGVVLIAVVPIALVAWFIPALTIDLVVVPALLVAATVAAAHVRLGARRVAQYAAAVVVVGACVGTSAVTRSAAARLAILERGTASDLVAARIRALGDGDGDGFAGPGVGGADCDDGDRARHPGAVDVPDNGIDENCSGADAVRTTFALRNQPRPVPPVQVRPNILLVSIDALRADHLGSYGYRRKTSPALDGMAAAGVRFAMAYTPCPSTRCALPALHTGRYASTLGALDGGGIPTLAQVLARAGYDTAAITCCERFAVARRERVGFAHLDATADSVRMRQAGQDNADVVVDRTLEWLRGRERSRPYFAWLHLYEPHFPYAAPSGPVFGSGEADRYDAEIAAVDAQLARLLAAVEPQTIVVVTSDHGEELGEHGIRFHARSLYNAVVRVPLVMRVPGVAARVVDAPVSLVDVMPTLLDLAGVEGPPGMNGRTLGPALRGGSIPARALLVELPHDHQIKRDMAAAISPPYKVIWDRIANAWSLFRLDDAGDERDLAGEPALREQQHVLMELIDRETGALVEGVPPVSQ